MSKRVFLVHGWEGRPDNHWFPWLLWELKARGFDVYSIPLPNPDNPKLSEWLSIIKAIVVRPDKNTFFVGHSLGCLAILRFFEKLPKMSQVGGAVFVAGFIGDINIPQIEEFYADPLDTEKVKNHCKKMVTIFSDDDPYVSMEKSLEFQKALGAKAIMEKGRGHFSKSDGVIAMPSVFRSLMDMAS